MMVITAAGITTDITSLEANSWDRSITPSWIRMFVNPKRVPESAGINLLKFGLVAVIFSMYFSLFGLLYRLICMRIRSWIIFVAPALWVGLEYTRSNVFFLSWPWNLMGHSQYRYLPVIQIAGITGVYGVSFLIVMTNQFLSQIPDFFTMRRAASGSNITGYSEGIPVHEDCTQSSTNWPTKYVRIIQNYLY